jgi:ParB/RepB/Spo0J family partition protein
VPIKSRRLNGNAPAPEFFEIVAGERRYRAGTLAKLDTVPAIVRLLSDQETLELQLIENLQRDDLDPFEEALGYQALLNLRDGHNQPIHTVDTIHHRVGKSCRRIWFRLKLLKAPKPVRDAVIQRTLAVAIAEEIGSIPTKEMREAAADEILHPDNPDKEEGGPLSAKRAREVISTRYMRSLAGAPFDPKDATLIEILTDDQTSERIGGGACTDCPMRTGNMEAIIGKTKRPDVCTNPKCFLMKCDAQFARLQADAVKDGKRVMTSAEVAQNFEANPESVNFGELRFDSDFVKLTDKPYPVEVRRDFAGRLPHWKTLLDSLPEETGRPPVCIARDPRGRIVELVERELAKEAVNLAAKRKSERSLFDVSGAAALSGGDGRVSTRDTSSSTTAGVESPWRAQERKNREIAKFNFQFSLAGMAAVIDAIDAKGPVAGFWNALIETAIEHAGHDGCWLICKRLGLDPKAKNPHAKREGLEGAVLEYGLTLPERPNDSPDGRNLKLGFVVELLLSKNVKLYNSGSFGGIRQEEHFIRFAKLYKIDIGGLEKEVRQSLKPKEKSKAKATKTKPTKVKVVEHDWEKITDNKYRCRGCGAAAVKHDGKILAEKSVRGKPCSRSEVRERPKRTIARRVVKSKKKPRKKPSARKAERKKGGAK